jgi:hypothetical protein
MLAKPRAWLVALLVCLLLLGGTGVRLNDEEDL